MLASRMLASRMVILNYLSPAACVDVADPTCAADVQALLMCR